MLYIPSCSSGKSSIYAILTAVSIMVNIVVIVVSIDMVVLCAVFY